MEQFLKSLSQTPEFRLAQKRPFILVSYAQSINGSIASATKKPVHLSGQESLMFTHRLRAHCDAILIGIGTVLADNPQLTTRLVQGPDPQPIVLDTRLRMPLTARLVRNPKRSVWIICNQAMRSSEIEQWLQTGATIIPCATDKKGGIDLYALMEFLAKREINSVMVEGGEKIITSFINARLVDQFIITIAPKLLDGLPVIESSGLNCSGSLSLTDIHYQQLGDDIVLYAKPIWPTQ